VIIFSLFEWLVATPANGCYGFCTPSLVVVVVVVVMVVVVVVVVVVVMTGKLPPL
jgi:hypothetical protein